MQPSLPLSHSPDGLMYRKSVTRTIRFNIPGDPTRVPEGPARAARRVAHDPRPEGPRPSSCRRRRPRSRNGSGTLREDRLEGHEGHRDRAGAEEGQGRGAAEGSHVADQIVRQSGRSGSHLDQKEPENNFLFKTFFSFFAASNEPGGLL